MSGSGGAPEMRAWSSANLGRELGAASAHAAALELVVDTARRAFRVPYAAIDLEHDGAFEPAASQGAPAGELTTVPFGYAGVTVGRLTIGKSDLTETDRRLLVDLSRQAAIAAHAARLTGDLQRSRERLVAAREEERRRLRRDLHDGLGPTLAGMLLQLDAADLLVDSDPARRRHGARRAEAHRPAGHRRHPAAGLRAAPPRSTTSA